MLNSQENLVPGLLLCIFTAGTATQLDPLWPGTGSSVCAILPLLLSSGQGCVGQVTFAHLPNSLFLFIQAINLILALINS